MRDLTLKEVIQEEYEAVLDRLSPRVKDASSFMVDEHEDVYQKEGGGTFIPKNHSWGYTVEVNGTQVSHLVLSQVEAYIRSHLRDNLVEFVKHEFLHQRGFSEEEVIEEEKTFNPFV